MATKCLRPSGNSLLDGLLVAWLTPGSSDAQLTLPTLRHRVADRAAPRYELPSGAPTLFLKGEINSPEAKFLFRDRQTLQ